MITYLLDRSFYRNTDWETIKQDYLGEFLRDYAFFFNLSASDVCASCTHKLRGYYERFMKHIDDKKSVYIAHERFLGLPLRPGSREVLSNVNMTDTLAKKFIKEHPMGEKLFASLPEEKKQVAKKPRVAKKKTASKAGDDVG